MKTNQFTLRHLLMAFACGMLLVGGLSLTAPQRVSSNIYGDVNGDGVVDIENVSEVINVILGYYDGHGDAGPGGIIGHVEQLEFGGLAVFFINAAIV